jgi:hypothetical protein
MAGRSDPSLDASTQSLGRAAIPHSRVSWGDGLRRPFEALLITQECDGIPTAEKLKTKTEASLVS